MVRSPMCRSVPSELCAFKQTFIALNAEKPLIWRLLDVWQKATDERRFPQGLLPYVGQQFGSKTIKRAANTPSMRNKKLALR